MTRKQLRVLYQVLETAKMGNADFGPDTDKIKEQTKLWREAWIIAPLQRLLAEAEADYADRSRKRKGEA